MARERNNRCRRLPRGAARCDARKGEQPTETSVAKSTSYPPVRVERAGGSIREGNLKS